MQIGGITINVECMTMGISHPIDSVYHGFAEERKTGADGAFDITVNLEADGMPDTKGMEKIFESESSWSMLLDGGDRLISLKPPQFENPSWIARMGKDFKDVRVYCGDRLIERNGRKQKISSPVCYPLDQLLVIYFLSMRNGALIHAAGLEIQGKGLIFPGKSGAGKSTLCHQMSGKSDIKLLSDDRMIVKKEEGGFVTYGTPWPGEAGIAENRKVSLAGLMFLSQGKENRIKRISDNEALKRLMPVTSIPWYDRSAMEGVFGFCEMLSTGILAYELEFRPEVEVADVICKFMQDAA